MTEEYYWNKWLWCMREKRIVLSENNKKTPTKFKGKRYIAEKVKYINNSDLSYHTFYLYVDSVLIEETPEKIFNCSYDRGPRRINIIEKLWNK